MEFRMIINNETVTFALTLLTGSSAACPPSSNVPDKTKCDEDSVCFRGVCICLFISTFQQDHRTRSQI